MKKALETFKPYLPWLLLAMAFVFGQSAVNLAIPDYISKIVDQGIISGNLASIGRNGLIMITLTVFGGLLTVGISFLASKISAGYARHLRQRIFLKVESFSLDEFNSFSTSSLVTRATNDIQQVQSVTLMLIRMSLLAPFMGIGAIVKTYRLAPEISWVAYIAIGILAVVIVFLFTAAVPKFSLIQKLVDKLGLQTRELLSGVRVIRAYGKDGFEQERFGTVNKESADLNILVTRLMSLMDPVMILIMGISSVAVVWFGAYLVSSGNLQIGSVMALVQYISQAIMSFLMLSIIFIMVPRAAVSLRRIEEILEKEPEIKDPAIPAVIPENVEGRLEFSEVSFSYQGSEEPVLKDLSFTIEPGQVTAIIGGTGSGKSTLVNLIGRFYDASSGKISLGGYDVKGISQHDLHRLIAYVPQKASLFSGTVYSNILYGNPEASRAEIERAAAVAQATEFIERLPEGFDSPISQGGDNVSGGQKQRLAIARALVKKAPIYLFDDSFSALDFRTDASLRKALRQELAGRAIIIVGQRIGTVMDADKIIVLDEGRLVGQGKHRELMESCPVYREIAESQLSAAELNR